MNHAAPEQSSRIPWGALFVGTLLGIGVLGLIRYGPLRGTLAERYVSHPVEAVEVIMFGCAIAAFASKWRRARQERRALRADILPAWDGTPLPVAESGLLSAEIERLPLRLRRTSFVRRVSAILNHIMSRKSTQGFDEHLRTLADNDAMALEGSYSLTRFITWAIPILGFLGTVLGITEAIAGVTPEVLEQSLSSVTDGLALAFDSTALALGLTMAAMFINFLVERAEWGALEAIDLYVERQLAHRFERSADTDQMSADLWQGVVERLVKQQAEVWAESLAVLDRRRVEADARAEKRLTVAMEQALERTLKAHAERMAALETQAVSTGTAAVERLASQARAVCDSGKEQQQALAKLVQGVAAQVHALGQLNSSAEQLLRLQATLDRNLTALTAAGTLHQAVHSLTAAIHLLTTRADPNRLRKAA
jgi:biopolymer transport protein ExbB/TolQ